MIVYAASSGGTDIWGTALASIPKFIAFLVILVIGWLVARASRALTDRLLNRVGFRRAAERGGVAAALARAHVDAAKLVSLLVYYAVLLFTLELAFGLWGPNPVSALLGGIVGWLPKAFVAVVIVVVSTAIGTAVRNVIVHALDGLSYNRIVANTAAWLIIGIGVIAALNQIGVATSVTIPVLIAVLATIAGILIVGVGGGLIRPMQQRWQSWLDRVAEETPTMAARARAYADNRRAAEQAAATAAASGPAPAAPTTPAPRGGIDVTGVFPAVAGPHAPEAQAAPARPGPATPVPPATGAGTPPGDADDDRTVTIPGRVRAAAGTDPDRSGAVDGADRTETIHDPNRTEAIHDPNRTEVINDPNRTAVIRYPRQPAQDDQDRPGMGGNTDS